MSAGGSGPFARLARGPGEELALSWSTELPKPVVKDNVATFADAGGTGVDLVVTTSSIGMRYDIVLRSRPQGPVEFKIPISTKGLQIGRIKGRLDLTGKSGKIRARGSKPVMWSAATPGKAGYHSRRGERGKPGAIAHEFIGEGDRTTLVLKPDADFLSDPATHYPVTVDPTVVLPINADTEVDSIYGSAPTGPYMRVGTDIGNQRARAYLKFDTAGLPTTIAAAKLTLRNVDAPTCGTNVGDGIQVRRVTGAWDANMIDWATQPTNTTTDAVLSREGSQGYTPGTCGSGYMNWDVTAIVQKWATGTANHGLVLRAPTEGGNPSYWVYTSSEETVEFNSPPKLAVTYTVPPTVGTLAVSPGLGDRTNSLTPSLLAQLKDDDGNMLTGEFEVQRGGATIWTGTVANVASGGEAKATIPAVTLADGQQISWRVRAFDGTTHSPYSAWQTFSVDISVPQPPVVSCATYPAGAWTAKHAAPVDCTFDSPSANVTGYTWRIDDVPQAATVVGDPATASIDPAEGWHTLTVRANSVSGTSSADATYAFGVGVGEVVKPDSGDRTQAAVTLASHAKPVYATVRYQYRSDLSAGGVWTDIPAAHVTVPGTPGAISGWPQTRSDTSKDFADLTWDSATTLSTRGDGPVEIRACFNATDEQCSKGVRFTLERTAFGASYATHGLGPGSVSLLTGDYSISAVDASTSELSVGRGHTTLSPAASGVFGPGWTDSLPVGSSDVSAMKFSDKSANGFVLFTGPDGAQLAYTVQPDGTFKGTGEAIDGSVVVRDSATQFTHTSRDGVKTVFGLIGNVWNMTSIDEPGANNTITYQHDGQGRVTRILAPVPSGVSCSPSPAAGCQSMQVAYASATTATGVGSGWGDFLGQVASVSYTAFDPVNSTVKTTVMATYRYDSTGHLRAVSDPRTNLTTTYYYNGQGRISQVAPPGLVPWTIAYDSAGRIAHVSRTSPQGELIEAVAYDLPIGGSGAPIDLTSAATSTWAQSAGLPRIGAAVFPPSRVPARNSSGIYTPSAADYPYASLTYLDVNGRGVNTAAYGAGAWQISTTRYDNTGNTVWELSPGNRAQALAPTLDTDAVVSGMASSAERANALAKVTTYNSKGNVIREIGPARRITLVSGRVVFSARLLTEHTYDEGAPADRVDAGLVTTTTTKPIVLDGSAAAGATDTQTVKTGYDAIVPGDPSGWELYQATSEKEIVPGGPDIVRRTRYDSAAREVEQRMPASSGSDAGTTVSSYYSVGPNGVAACGNTPQWAGKLCRTGPAAQPTGKALPVTTVTYDYYGQTAQSVEDNGTAVRTTTTTIDVAGRQVTKDVAVSPVAAGGTSLPTVTYTYDPATGQQSGVTAGGQSITTVHDALGRVTTQTNATGTTATTTYDAAGRVASLSDGVGTTSYGYDGNDADGRAERRGLPTSLSADTHVFFGSYDANGQLTTQVYPGGLTASTRYDSVGQQAKLTYIRNTTTWLDYTIRYDVTGRISEQTGPTGGQSFTYDGAGRLTKVADTHAGTCTIRTYAFDVNSNRTGLITYPGAAGGSCSTTTTPVTRSSAFDSADRIVDAGYAYDNFGRTTTVPGSHTTGAQLGVGYFANDMVASLTQESTTKTFTLDPLGRPTSATVSGQHASGTITNHYVGSSDSPAWIGEANGTWTRNVTAFGGLAATLTNNGTLTLHLTNPHNDVVATAERLGSGVNAYFEQTEYGVPRSGDTTGARRYGWLGGSQRSAEAMAGLIQMGVRLYNPATGRFLQVDPVPGGSANAYDYAAGDPVNKFDLNGKWIIDHRPQCNTAGCVHAQRWCDGRNRCSLAWGVKLRGVARSAYRVSLYYSISINGKHVVGPAYYGHDEPGTYTFHGSWGLPGGRHARGYYACGIFNFLTCHMSPFSRIRIEFSGNLILQGGRRARLFGYGSFTRNS
ncbi:RHS repeat-associated core domain-containing protein [Sinosporangium album]|uniref:RHS repeat-associated core domain-containing protein n=1 Tax=Sinosporangium album TaxID=504805 RepID=A0A1G7QKT6_9ACTN|nr:DNRLRE domain-containing protein [Sinosporangium album]SDF98240.1 RHS repeat-associated core domain-containing protein [Sinosporangium album]